MKPYYAKHGVVIVHAKAEEVLLQREYFGALVLDPPFTFSLERTEAALQPFAPYLAKDCSLLLLTHRPEMTTHPAFGHPHVRSLDQVREALRATAGPILDPYMGTGTTLVAAKQLGRHAVGIEIEEKYCKMAVYRLEHES